MTLGIVAASMLCSSMALAGNLSKPKVMNDESVNIAEKLSSNYDTLIIKNFTYDKAGYENVSSDERKVIDKISPNLVRTISDTAEAELGSKKIFRKILKEGKSAGRAVILEGEITEYNAGSKALKMFVGYGAGKAYLKVKGRLLDAASGKELATFEDQESGYLGSMSTMSFDDVFPLQAKSIGESIAKFIEAIY
jgi:hypothetical protein